MAPPNLADAPAVALLDRPLELPQSFPELATRAMQRFRCLGSACDDNCCRDFGIDIDRSSLDRMRAAARSPEDRERVVRLVVLGMRPRAGGPSRNLVQLDESGGCPMLDSDGRCGVHRDYGEQVLSTVCSVFPRTSLAVEGRLEVTGSLACPELARLSLLAEDGLEQGSSGHPVGEPVLPRAYVGKSLDTQRGGLYNAAFTRTRAALGDLFRREDFTIGTRFAFAATLAAELEPFFRRDADPVGPAEATLLRRRLESELNAMARPDHLAALNADLAAMPDTPPAVVTSVAALLTGRLRLAHPARFASLVRGALASLGADSEDAAIDSERGAAELRGRRATLDALAPGLMDRLLGRYARHHLLRNPYTERRSLMAYLKRLGTDLAALRLLWLASPRLHAFVGSGSSLPGSPVDAAESAAAARSITDAGIEVIQAYTKAVSHHVDFLSAVHDGDAGAVRFGALILIARFI